MSGFDSSDEESGDFDLSQFPIWWVDLSAIGRGAKTLAISGLPGCRFKDTWRRLQHDLDCVKTAGIKDVFVLCGHGELQKYRVPTLLKDMEASRLIIHHHPFPDGEVPTIETFLPVLQKLSENVKDGTKTLVHCYGGLGRSAVVAACVLMLLDSKITADTAIDTMRRLRGPGAVQSVKQYNFLQDFRENAATVSCLAIMDVRHIKFKLR
ncbi:Cyclin-dependent kinase inhibitor 3 [Lamellibrachia satsuma]|nr:Cyclin-dependent kinase inhibitor 3 [Lamellibrachia satsuma]